MQVVQRSLPFLLLQVAAAVVEEQVHVLGQGALDDARAVVEEVDELVRVQDLELLLLRQLVRRRCTERDASSVKCRGDP